MQQHHFQQIQKCQQPKQQSNAITPEQVSLNNQARQELQRHFSELKTMGQSTNSHQNQNTVTSEYYFFNNIVPCGIERILKQAAISEWIN